MYFNKYTYVIATGADDLHSCQLIDDEASN